ncbi:hypothetical protein C8A03DRAFT_36243 [Achaetomium macrosporum]|uniref:Uncharacterized protein n=1 Tax=Achaetomium macrosporum TaxID=79813 RepID=A0AAN7H5F6_9PEZI|nr:hypothetical protein C8A03DRAFT_36243 [Achaetomium macrosporum]
MASSHLSRPSSGNAQCQASIEVCMDFLSLDMGRLSIPAETCLFSLLSQCFTKIKSIFNINDPQNVLEEPSALDRILSTIFDTASVAFVTEKSVRIVAGLDDHDKSCLCVQAVAGMVLFFRRVSAAGTVLSAGLFSRELQLFAESEQRRALLDKIESSSLFSSCYTKSSMVDFVLAAVENDGDIEHNDGLPLAKARENLSADSVAWGGSRPYQNMGLPWGFTIMALN